VAYSEGIFQHFPRGTENELFQDANFWAHFQDIGYRFDKEKWYIRQKKTIS
jgi:hypothetical protein